MAESVYVEEMIDFSPPEKSIRFRIGGDVFVGKPVLPTGTALEFAAKLDGLDSMDVSEKLDAIKDLVRLILISDSSELFISRLYDADNPIGLDTFKQSITWLFEQYSGRPTVPGSDS